MKKITFIITLLVCAISLEGSWWDDAWDTVKSTANTVGDGIKEAGEWVGDRFKDTQVTRAVDFGVRLGALESAQAVAQGILEASQFVSDTTLAGSYETAKLGVKAAEEFLDKVVQNAAYGVLEGSRLTANGVLEGAKQASVGVLEGGRWVVNNTLGSIDVNCIHYDGNLQDLATLNLGNVLVRGTLIRPFQITMTLDLKHPLDSVGEFAKSIGKMMESAFLDPAKEKIDTAAGVPLDQALQKIVEGGMKASLLEDTLAGADMQTPSEFLAGQNKLVQAQDQVDRKKRELESAAAQARAYIMKSSSLGFDELIAFVAQQGTEITRETTAAKQELARRLRQKKKAVLEAASKIPSTPVVPESQTPVAAGASVPA